MKKEEATPKVLSFVLSFILSFFNQADSRRCKGLNLLVIVICFNPIFIGFIYKDTQIIVVLVVFRSLRVLKVSCWSGRHLICIGLSWRFFAFHHRVDISTINTSIVINYNTGFITFFRLYGDLFSPRLYLTFILLIHFGFSILLNRWESGEWSCFAGVKRSPNLACFLTWRDIAIRKVIVIMIFKIIQKQHIGWLIQYFSSFSIRTCIEDWLLVYWAILLKVVAIWHAYLDLTPIFIFIIATELFLYSSVATFLQA